MRATTTIDKVEISTPIFNVNSVTHDALAMSFHSKPQGKPMIEQTLLIDANGIECPARNIYYNHPESFYQCDIHRNQQGEPTLYLKFNPKRFHHDLLVAQQFIDDDLKNMAGIEIGFNHNHKPRLYRIDFAGDCMMQNEITHYRDPIEMVMKRRYQSENNRTIYPHSMLYRFTDWQKCTYDKGLKNMIDDGLKVEVMATNLMRDEIRLVSSRTINKWTGLHTWDDLLKVTNDKVSRHRVELALKVIEDSKTTINIDRDIQNDYDAYKTIYETHKQKKSRATVFMATYNHENNHNEIKRRYQQVIQMVAQQTEFPSRSAKSHWIKSELKAFDETAMMISALRKHKQINTPKLLACKVEEYKDKFLTA